MKKDPWVSVEEGVKRFVSLGFKEPYIPNLFYPKKGIRESELALVETLVREIGVGPFYHLYGVAHFTTLRQLKRRRLSRKRKTTRLSFRVLFLSFLKSFTPYFGSIINDASLRRNGYEVKLVRSMDRPFESSFLIVEKSGGAHVAYFSFDTFLDKQGKPCIAVGNMQGVSKEAIGAFKQKLGLSPLDFFLRKIKETFPDSKQVFALNPRHHYAYRNPERYVIGNIMHDKRQLSDYERDYVRDREAYVKGKSQLKIPSNPAIDAKVDAEIRRIVTNETGMHKAAFKKAGFKPTKSRMWRLRPH